MRSDLIWLFYLCVWGGVSVCECVCVCMCAMTALYHCIYLASTYICLFCANALIICVAIVYSLIFK